MMAEVNEATSSKQPVIRRGRVDSLTLYEITDYELDVLATGSPSSVYLNLSTFFLTTFATFLVALLATTPGSDRVYIVFVVVATIALVAGLVLLVLWRSNRQALGPIVRRIKDRIPAADAGTPGA